MILFLENWKALASLTGLQHSTVSSEQLAAARLARQDVCANDPYCVSNQQRLREIRLATDRIVH